MTTLRWRHGCGLGLLVGVLGLTWGGGSSTSAGAGGAVQKEWVPGKHMQVALTRVMASAKAAVEKSNLGWDDGTCLLGALLQPGKSVTFRRELTQGVPYLIVGGGDADAEDVDIELLDSGGTVVEKDTLADAIPVVRYTPPRSGTYVIRLTLYKANVMSFCAMAILKRDGYTIPVRNLAAAAGRLLAQCEGYANRNAGKLYFYGGQNQWAVFGTVMRSGQTETISGLRLGDGQRHALAAADDNAQDIDLYLLDSNGDVLKQDEDDDAVPYFAFRAGTSPSYGLRLKNVKSNGPTLVMAAVLQQE